jgi:hypothetical protein
MAECQNYNLYIYHTILKENWPSTPQESEQAVCSGSLALFCLSTESVWYHEWNCL